MTHYATPITDRAAADLVSRTAKAFWNVADWVRVYGNARIANQILVVVAGYGVTFTELTAPVITTIPTVAEFNQFLANIERLRLASGLLNMPGMDEIRDDWQAGTAAQSPDYVDANLWEAVIDIVYMGIYCAVGYGIYCGVAAAGQIRYYQHRWRAYPGWVPDVGSPTRKARVNVAVCGAGLTRNNGFRRYS